MPDFSTPATHAFEEGAVSDVSSRSISSTPPSQIWDTYEIAHTIRVIMDGGYRSIALQFPDELLGDSVLVYRAIMMGLRRREQQQEDRQSKAGTEAPNSTHLPSGEADPSIGTTTATTTAATAPIQCYVLGDSTYGACCPDVLSSLHLPADLLVHYGHACLTPTESLPVMYVFPRRSLKTSTTAAAMTMEATQQASKDEQQEEKEARVKANEMEMERAGARQAADELWKAAAAADAADATASSTTEDGTKMKHAVIMWEVGYDWLADDLIRAFETSTHRPQGASCTVSRINKSSGLFTSSSGAREPRAGVVADLAAAAAAAADGRTKATPTTATRSCGGCAASSSSSCAACDGASASSCCRSSGGSAQGSAPEARSSGGCGRNSSACATGASACGSSTLNRPDPTRTTAEHMRDETELEAAAEDDREGDGNERAGEEGFEDLGGVQVGRPPQLEGKEEVKKDSESLTTPPASLRTFDLPSGVSLGDCFILYVGDQDSPSLANLMMENAATPIYAYSPTPNGGGERAVLASARTSSMLSRRLFAVHRAMAASTFGILVHNVGLARSRTVVRALRELLQSHGKKSYTVSVGRLNPAKLANFEVVECWVLVGCREAGLVDPKEYYRPIVTPWELQLALQGDAGEWAPERWTLDFEQVIRETQELSLNATTTDPDRDADAPVFSLASGQYHSSRNFAEQDEVDDDGRQQRRSDDGQALVVKNQQGTVARREGLDNVAGNYLATRSWKGLDANEGLEAGGGISVLEQGRSGIARGYGHEKE